jgi:alkylmercury lyase
MSGTPASAADIPELAEALNSAFPRLDATDRRIAMAVYRLLGRGRPASVEEIAVASDVTPADVAGRLGAWPAVFRDGEGRVVGFWGLTIADMPPHELLVGDVKLWAWCAWDTLFLPAHLGGMIEVRSICPITDEPIQLRVAPDHVESVTPDGVVVSF